MPDSMERLIKVRDGRYYAVIDRQASDQPDETFFLFQGTPGSRLTTERLAKVGRDLKLRLITLDRPGFGRSDPDYPRQFTRYVEDITAIADALEIERFSIAGVSGGGAHAMACAAGLPDRVQRLELLASAVPMADSRLRRHKGANQLALKILNLSPHLFRLFNWLATRAVASAARDSAKMDALVARMIARLPEADRKKMAEEGVAQDLAANLSEAFLQGGRAVAEESLMVARDWEFSPSDISCPTRWWHGREDEHVPYAIAEEFSGRIPGARFVPLAGGHSAWMEELERILTP